MTPSIRIPVFLVALGILSGGKAPLVRAQASATISGERLERPPDLKQDFFRAERAWRSGSNLLEAKVRLDRVLDFLPDDHEAVRLRARVLLALDRPADALDDAARLTELLPLDADAWILRAEACLDRGITDSATVALRRAARLTTDEPGDHARMSRLAQRLDLLDEAETYARVGLAMAPDDPSLHSRLAHVFVAQGRPNDAATLLARALQSGVYRPDLLTSDPVLAPLRNHPTLRSLF